MPKFSKVFYNKMPKISTSAASSYDFLFCNPGSGRPDRVQYHFIIILMLPEVLTVYLSEISSFLLCSGRKNFFF